MDHRPASAARAAARLAIDLGPFAVGRMSPAGSAIIAQAEREADAAPSDYDAPFHHFDEGCCIHCGCDDHDEAADGPCIPHEPVTLTLESTP